MIRGITVPEVWHMMDVIVIFHFRQLFATEKVTYRGGWPT